jgi:putative oxidoreductase
MNNIALLLIRIVFAGSMLYGHGLSKFYRLIEGNLSFANPIGIGEAPTLVLAVFSEFLAPLFILIGYKTKIFSFFPAATMFVAAFIVHLSDPFARKEKAILFLIGFIAIMMMGPGKYSIDRKFS